MDAFETMNPNRPLLRWRGVFVMGMISLALYLSGILVWLTPLPILYAYRCGPRVKGLVAVLLPVVLLWFCYDGILPYVASHDGTEQALKYFFWLPGVGLSTDAVTWNSAIFGICYYLFFAAMGAVLGELEPQSFRTTPLMGIAAGFLTACLALWLGFYTFGHWTSFVQGLEDYFVQSLKQISQMAPQNEEMQAQWAMLQSHAPTIAHYAVRLLPGMICNVMIFVLWLNIVVARRFFGTASFFSSLRALRRPELPAWPEGGEEIPGFFASLGPLKCWRLPFAGVWVVIGFAFLWILDAYVLQVEWLNIAALNAFLVFSLVYFFQGLAILTFYVSRWRVPPMIRLVLYVVFFLFIQPLSVLLVVFGQPLSVLLVAFGFFDSWFDFRKLNPKSA